MAFSLEVGAMLAGYAGKGDNILQSSLTRRKKEEKKIEGIVKMLGKI